ncbi:MAG: prephenate dehydrogenase/arogenate dehydrogenase family protein [Methanomassiliicoccaceae archaeon]|nr:prephenate dehydrogenase/arogenate dehydrogenase family protein [Methanomassiliicoccaceae archaeon]
MNDLDTLRKMIGDIDSEIIRLMIKRNDVAGIIGEVKIRNDIPLRNKDVEKEVIERYLKLSENSSLPADVAEFVGKALISASVDLQYSLPRKRIEKNVTVIGGKGKMGQWISGYFEDRGSVVNVVDVSAGSMNDAENSDIVVISVPIPSAASVLKEAERVCRKDALIFDISSVKTSFSSVLKDAAERRKVCSVHPMFGPSSRSAVDRRMIICDCGNNEAVSEAAEIFSDEGMDIIITGVERHDELMSYVLALAHASNIVFFTALRSSGIPFNELKSAGSTTFDKMLGTCIPVSGENASLYHDIQRLNVSTEKMWTVFEKAFGEVKDASLSNDPERFTELMELGKKYFEE